MHSLPWALSERPRCLEEYVAQMNEPAAAPYDLHPSILATCQILFEEGRALLYGSNTVCLQMNPSGVILYADTDMFAARWDDNDQVKTNDQFDKLLERFDKVHIDVNCTPEEDRDIKAIALGMAGILDGKHVQIEFIDPGDAIYSLQEYDVAGAMQDQLRFFKLMRCRTFEVVNSNLDPSRVSEIAEIVTSDQPIVNLWPSFTDFEDYFLSLASFCYDHQPDYCATYMLEDHDQYFEMEEAASDCDAVRFRAARAKWMEEIDHDYTQRTKIAFRNDMLHMI